MLRGVPMAIASGKERQTPPNERFTTQPRQGVADSKVFLIFTSTGGPHGRSEWRRSSWDKSCEPNCSGDGIDLPAADGTTAWRRRTKKYPPSAARLTVPRLAAKVIQLSADNSKTATRQVLNMVRPPRQDKNPVPMPNNINQTMGPVTQINY